MSQHLLSFSRLTFSFQASFGGDTWKLIPCLFIIFQSRSRGEMIFYEGRKPIRDPNVPEQHKSAALNESTGISSSFLTRTWDFPSLSLFYVKSKPSFVSLVATYHSHLWVARSSVNIFWSWNWIKFISVSLSQRKNGYWHL